MSKPPDEHEWFRAHLPDQLLDLLVDGERRRFEAHAHHCATCARLLTSALGARTDWWDGAGHPPVGVLLDWDASARGDRTHEAVRAHVAACEDCRRDLGDLRGEALLSEIALAPVAPAQRPARRRSGMPWGGLAAAAATVVAVTAIALVWPRGADREPAPAPPVATPPAAPAGQPAEASSPPAQAASPARTAEPVTLIAPERGVAAEATEIRLEPGVERVPLTLPMFAVPDDVMLEVDLRDAAGTLVSRQLLAAERALRSGGVELAAGGLREGSYLLTIRWIDPATGENSREFPLDVRLSR